MNGMQKIMLVVAVQSAMLVIYYIYCTSLIKTNAFKHPLTSAMAGDVPTAPSWFRSSGLAELNLLKEMNEPRPLSTFTILPWRVVPQTPRNILAKDIRWSMVVAIKSHYRKEGQRNLVRKTWGSIQYFNGVRIEVAFVVAAAESAGDQSSLLKENATHGDILQVSMKETYSNIGLKAIAAMQWAEETFSPNNWIYFSADDDILPDLTQLLHAIDDLTKHSNQTFSVQDNPMLCSLRAKFGDAPKRAGTWEVDTQTYPLNKYPSFCLGGFYSMPMQISNAIFRISRNHIYFKMDDVWITGILRLKLCDSLQVTSNRFYFNKSDKNCAISSKPSTNTLHIPNTKKHEFVKKWQQIEKEATAGENVVIKRQTNEYHSTGQVT